MLSADARLTLEDRIRRHPQWYHTLELRPGLVTPGWFDTRSVVAALPIPASLAGSRCLDIGTFDGFWAFEMERRGAAEVVAIDLLDRWSWDWPRNSGPDAVRDLAVRQNEGAGFELARAALGSRVERREMSVYHLEPETVGTFDFVYMGSLLLHLKSPVAALEAVRAVCRGQLLSVDGIDLGLSFLLRHRPVAELDGLGRPWWWKPNVAGHVRMLESAGFSVVGRPQRLLMPPGRGQPREQLRWSTLRRKAGRNAVFRSWKGDPHCAVLARPA